MVYLVKKKYLNGDIGLRRKPLPPKKLYLFTSVTVPYSTVLYITILYCKLPYCTQYSVLCNPTGRVNRQRLLWYRHDHWDGLGPA